MRLWLLGLCLAVAAAGSRAPATAHSDLIILGTATKGVVYLAGKELTPPYVFTLDLSKRAEFINGLPLWVLDPDTISKAAMESTAADPIFRRHGEVMKRAMTVSDSLRRLGFDEREIMWADAKVYEDARDVVDSVLVRGPGSKIVFWNRGSEYFTSSPSPPERPPTRAHMDSLVVEEMTEMLERGAAIIFEGKGLGVYAVIGAPLAATLRAQVDSLRAGLTPASPTGPFRDPRFADQFRKPRRR